MRSHSFLIAFVAGVMAAMNASPPGAVVVTAGSNLQSIVNANPGKTLYLQAGRYSGPVVIKSKMTIIGATDDESSYGGNKVTISISRAQELGFDNHHTAAVQVEADGVKFYNVDFENTWGLQKDKKNQALAVSTRGDQIGFYGCKFDGWQDTIETEGKDGKSLGKQVFAKCLIQGTTDFIFGKSAAAWFQECDIKVKNNPSGYITAQGRDSESGGGRYVFHKCNVGGNGPVGKFFLGRPWRPYARVMFQYCKLSAVVADAGWTNWNATASTDNLDFEEYKNAGPGAKTGRSLGKQGPAPISINTVLGGSYTSWVDMKYMGR